jgi:uncharacterized membrane protein YdjX (TVP38/TMEM64 family)
VNNKTSFALFVQLILAIAFIVWFFDLTYLVDRTFVEHVVDSMGAFGPIGFIATYALVTILLLPGVILNILAGPLFGPIVGAIFVTAGATIGATFDFVLSRKLGKPFFRDKVTKYIKHLDDYDRILRKRGILAVILLRLVPVLPFTIANIVLAFTGVKYRDFIAGTILGVLPVAFIYAYFGSAVFHLDTTNIILASLLVLSLFITIPFLKKKFIADQD